MTPQEHYGIIVAMTALRIHVTYDSDSIIYHTIFAYSALMLLVGWQEGHLDCKKTEWWSAGVVICLERGADFNGPLSGTTRDSRYQKGKTNQDSAEGRDSEWNWHQLGHMQVCTSLQTDNHASTTPLSFLQAGCPCCHPTNSVKAPKALNLSHYIKLYSASVS